VMEGLRTAPPVELGGLKVRQVRDYLRQQVLRRADSGSHMSAGADWSIDGDQKIDVPKSDLLIFDLDPAGDRAAGRPSGTEPKLKFYLFAYESPERSQDLPATKQQLAARLDAIAADLIAAGERAT